MHTKGPWRVGPVDDTVVTGPDGSVVAEIDGDYNQPDTWPVMEANARLIAAAPDLFEALELLVNTQARYIEELPGERGLGALTKARAALAKARVP